MPTLTFDATCSAAELDEIVEASPTPEPLQLAAWAEVKSADWDAERFGIRHEGRLVGTCQVLYRRLGGRRLVTLAYTARGPVFARDDVPAQWYVEVYRHVHRLALRRRALVLHVDPPVLRAKGRELYRALRQLGYAHQGFYTDMREIQPRASMMVTLPSDPDAIDDALPKKMRQYTRRARKRPFIYRAVGPDDLDDFMQVITVMAQRQEIAMRDAGYFAEMMRAFEGHCEATVAYLDIAAAIEDADRSLAKQQVQRERSAKSLEAKWTKKAEAGLADLDRGIERLREQRAELASWDVTELPLACSLVLYSGNRASYLYGGSTNDLRNYYAPYALISTRMQQAARRFAGVESEFVFDFGGVSGETDPAKDPRHGGLYTFKAAWGCDMIEYVGEFTRPILPGIGHAFTPATRTYKRLREWRRRRGAS
ncbi:peptidoglycan bridge formation glycyltransferase FemA/FemB family protein [Nanchangia anserum]|uniref:Peptidoglycan bridge formation glycyltransferase FemA/FemB family protein n=1 Tax=Nanchangia anserum TaxID=2692125 RepID=A0A8I0KQS4_9ACTO|nr:peptidoglycan bridge formation glycyltransferase FemA/FemB family protein [Nanchangia anserum]MBD3688732.1 peptidoglycan bridge formation glycyltransferase FemA/FemB family protein [Nanchangia anserum]QOX82475.1 peptidoglycan bridge formation glycyltransferase FemA/FemB family protein [Nanchangia anserum]